MKTMETGSLYIKIRYIHGNMHLCGETKQMLF
jgi:hypothetical protein